MAKQRTEEFEAVQDVPRRGRSRKLRLNFTPEGEVDWSSVPIEQREDVLLSLIADDALVAKQNELAASGSATNLLEVIEEKHLNFFLDAVEAAEQFFIPRMIARQRVKLAIPGRGIVQLDKGQFQIPPSVAKQAFKFRNREKLVKTGVKAANQNLPDKVKKMLTRVGPGTEFLGYFLLEMRAQKNLAMQQAFAAMQQAAQAHIAQHHKAPQQPPPKVSPERTNGHAVDAVESNENVPVSAIDSDAQAQEQIA